MRDMAGMGSHWRCQAFAEGTRCCSCEQNIVRLGGQGGASPHGEGAAMAPRRAGGIKECRSCSG